MTKQIIPILKRLPTNFLDSRSILWERKKENAATARTRQTGPALSKYFKIMFGFWSDRFLPFYKVRWTPNMCDWRKQAVTIITSGVTQIRCFCLKLCRIRFVRRHTKSRTEGYWLGSVTIFSDSVGFRQKYAARGAVCVRYFNSLKSQCV